MLLVPRSVGFLDLKLMKNFVSSELIWMSRDHSEEVSLSLLIMLVNYGFLLSMKICQCSVLDAEKWGMG
ncbi:hypothetical protein Goklo_000496 [Gossypium klotzschianum]|uniref:Uncharacterized protein n=1 Tax=Gossypium klotzschianum TaxID=34286 RepID=A0A7J8VX73_9ROSI|nr:hypothetical protein [Gossypium klotzschianum]